jgi:hypothetical protein
MIALAALTLSLELQRTSLDLLDGVAIEIAVHNSAATATTVTFPSPAEYEIDIMRGQSTLWSSATQPPGGVTQPSHTRSFPPGPSILAVYVWNAITADRSTPAPGDYTIRVKLLAGNATATQTDVPVHFINPVPVSAAVRLPAGDIVTIAGTLDATKGTLTDETGTINLGRRLLGAPAGTIAVRGYVRTNPDHSQVFWVQRWALMK